MSNGFPALGAACVAWDGELVPWRRQKQEARRQEFPSQATTEILFPLGRVGRYWWNHRTTGVLGIIVYQRSAWFDLLKLGRIGGYDH